MSFTNKFLSFGESCVKTILDENGIEYKKEYNIVNTKGTRQRIDFLLTVGNKRYAIEYNGRQHYYETTGSWKGNLERIKELDKLKEDYCRNQGIELLTIPFTIDTKKDIFNCINKFLNNILYYYNDNVPLEHKGVKDTEEFKKLYLLYTVEELSNMLDISKVQVKYTAKILKIYKQKIKVVGLKIKTGEEKEFSSVEEAKKYIGSGGVSNCLSGKNKSCKGWLLRYKDKDFHYKAKEITDKRIKVFKAVKGDKIITLPLQMLANEIGTNQSDIVDVAYGNKGRTQTKGYTINLVDDKEKNTILKSISYIDYVKSKNK